MESGASGLRCYKEAFAPCLGRQESVHDGVCASLRSAADFGRRAGSLKIDCQVKSICLSRNGPQALSRDGQARAGTPTRRPVTPSPGRYANCDLDRHTASQEPNSPLAIARLVLQGYDFSPVRSTLHTQGTRPEVQCPSAPMRLELQLLYG